MKTMMRYALLCGFFVSMAACLHAQIPEVTLRASTSGGLVGDLSTIVISMDNDLDTIVGYAFSIEHDPAVVSLISTNFGPSIEQLSGGPGPDFYQTEILANGFTLGAILSLCECWGVPLGIDFQIQVITYEILVSSGSSNIVFSSTLGSPPIESYVGTSVGSGRGFTPTTIDGELRAGQIAFRRGDCNSDSGFDIGDAIFVGQYLFLGGSTPVCLDACDSNNDGSIDVADSVFSLSYLFIGGSTPEAPFNICGLAPTPSPLGCLSSSCQ